jgi:hypothetical protein
MRFQALMVSAIAMTCPGSVKMPSASSHAGSSASFCSLIPRLRASAVCIPRQNAQWFICEAGS